MFRKYKYSYFSSGLNKAIPTLRTTDAYFVLALWHTDYLLTLAAHKIGILTVHDAFTFHSHAQHQIFYIPYNLAHVSHIKGIFLSPPVHFF
jgi:hypothetical protein